jgi:hypothetical protein
VLHGLLSRMVPTCPLLQGQFPGQPESVSASWRSVRPVPFLVAHVPFNLMLTARLLISPMALILPSLFLPFLTADGTTLSLASAAVGLRFWPSRLRVSRFRQML